MANSSHLLQIEDTSLEALLAPFLRTAGPRYRWASWLKCSFHALVWVIESYSRFEINWQIPMADGSTLTEPRHVAILESLRSWMIARLHVDSTGGKIYAPKVERRRLACTLHCIDYLLLLAETLGLMTNGLAALSSNDLRAMVAALASNRSLIVSVYDWPNKLTAFLRERITSLPDDAVARARQVHPDLEEAIPDPTDRLTSLSDREVVLARAFLTLESSYKPSSNDYRLVPKTSQIAAKLYAGTLFGCSLKLPIPLELCLGPEHRVVTECPRARVTSRRARGTDRRTLTLYIETIATLALLRAEGLDAPQFAVDDLKRFARTLDVKTLGRFRTLPQDVVFSSLRRAIEFAIEYGDALVDSYLAVATAAVEMGSSVTVFAEQRDIKPYLTDRCKQLGVCRWTIEPTNAGSNGRPELLSKAVWYSDLRANAALFESLRVLYGAIQFSIGLVMARRGGEMMDLVAGDCLDSTETRLVFQNRKSGPNGLREREARPIPPVAVRFVKLLERLQAGLIKIGALSRYSNLFAPPRLNGSVGLTSALGRGTYHEALDLLCDWMETALDEDGKRYYFRHHQLRRFFAMLFFWGGGFGGIDTLRWFLGHTDFEHLWHYITESTPGVTVRSVAAEWAAYGVKHATREAELLGAELAEHFGTDDFSVLDEEALVLHIEDLMVEGRLAIEPEFLDNGKTYRIAVVLRPKVAP